MKQRLLDIHLYAGLLCAPYLVVYGLSTLSFNHGDVLGPRPVDAAWEQRVALPPLADDRAMARAIRDSLGLVGDAPSWEVRRDSSDALRFVVSRPARRYRIHVAPDGLARVAETKTGPWGALRGLHGITDVPGWPLGQVWRFYTQLSIYTLVFSVVTGLIFCWTAPAARRKGLWFLSAGTAVLALLIACLVL